jgi:hypothetical protein
VYAGLPIRKLVSVRLYVLTLSLKGLLIDGWLFVQPAANLMLSFYTIFFARGNFNHFKSSGGYMNLNLLRFVTQNSAC